MGSSFDVPVGPALDSRESSRGKSGYAHRGLFPLFLPLAAAGQQSTWIEALGTSRSGMVAGAVGLLYALGAETAQYDDAGTAALAAEAEGRCRAGQTINPSLSSIANPL